MTSSRPRTTLRLAALTCALLSAPLTQAATGQLTVNATADNDFIVVHSQGNSHNILYRSNDGRDWKKAQKAKLKFEVKNLKECSIDIVAWDDHSVKQGLAAELSGNAGTVRTGDGVMQVFSTKIPNQASYAVNNYPSQSIINNIFSTLIPSSMHVHGVVGSAAPWGNAVSGIGAPTKWIWSQSALYGQPYAKNFTVYRTQCASVIKPPVVPNNKKGLTWRKTEVDAVTGVVDVGCGYSNGSNECNPYQGDLQCTTPAPILCKKELGLPKPNSVTIPNKYHKWSGNVVATTRPIAPATQNINTLTDANNACVAEFGSGWKVASHHDGWGWYFKAYGNIGTNVEGKRFWVNIRDQQNGNCWSQN